MTRVGRWVGVLGALMLTWAPSAESQTSWRIQSAWVNDHVLGLTIRVEARKPIGGVGPLTGDGPIGEVDRDWMLTGMIGAGANFNGPGTRGLEQLFYVHAGVLRKLGWGVEPRVGLVGMALLPAGSVGPAAMMDVMDIATVRLGWMFDGGAAVQIEVVGRFVCDLVC